MRHNGCEPKTVTRQRRGCDLNPGPSAPESSTLTTRLPSHPKLRYRSIIHTDNVFLKWVYMSVVQKRSRWVMTLVSLKPCSQQTDWTELNLNELNSSSGHVYSTGSVHTRSRRSDLNWTDLHQIDSVTRRVIGHTRRCHEVDWQLVQFVCCEHGLRNGNGMPLVKDSERIYRRGSSHAEGGILE